MKGSTGRLVARIVRDGAWVAPAGVVLLHEAGAHLFGHEPYVDPVIHFLGGAAMAFFLRSTSRLADELLGTPSPLALDLLSFGLTVVVALLWELGELVSDLTAGTHAQTTAANTLRDLSLGTAGALAWLALARLASSRSRHRL